MGALTLPIFAPLAECEDRFSVDERRETDDGIYAVSWLHKIDGYRGVLSASSSGSSSGGVDSPYSAEGGNATMSTQVSYTATILHRDKVRVPAMIVPGRSSNILKTEAEA